MFSKKIFCERLKAERLRLNLTQSQLGEPLGFRKQYISRWEKGEQEPTIANLVILAVFFDCSLDYLTGRADNPLSHKSSGSDEEELATRYVTS